MFNLRVLTDNSTVTNAEALLIRCNSIFGEGMDACSWSMLRRSDCRSNSRFPYDPRLPAFATVNQSQRGSGNTDVARGTKARTVKAILGREFEGRNNFPMRLSHACRSCQSPDQDPLNFLHSFTGLLQLVHERRTGITQPAIL